MPAGEVIPFGMLRVNGWANSMAMAEEFGRIV